MGTLKLVAVAAVVALVALVAFAVTGTPKAGTAPPETPLVVITGRSAIRTTRGVEPGQTPTRAQNPQPGDLIGRGVPFDGGCDVDLRTSFADTGTGPAMAVWHFGDGCDIVFGPAGPPVTADESNGQHVPGS